REESGCDEAMHARLRGVDVRHVRPAPNADTAAFLAMSVERQRPGLEAIARVDRHALRPANRSTPCRLIAASRGIIAVGAAVRLAGRGVGGRSKNKFDPIPLSPSGCLDW